MHRFLALPSYLLITSLITTSLTSPLGAGSQRATRTLTSSTTASLINSPTNSAVLIPASYPISGLVPQCNFYESVAQTDANSLQTNLAFGLPDGFASSCCTTAANQCSLLAVNGTAAVQLCSTGGSQCAECLDLAVAMKAIISSCSSTLLTHTARTGGQVAIPWMVNTTLQLNPAQQGSLSRSR